MGPNCSAVGTLVERTTRMPTLARIKASGARSGREGLTKKLRDMQAPLSKTLAHGLGNERSEQQRLAQ